MRRFPPGDVAETRDPRVFVGPMYFVMIDWRMVFSGQ